MGVVAVKFVEGGAAQLAIEKVHRSKMAGREVTCEYFDNITDYRMKEDETKVEERTESFVSRCSDFQISDLYNKYHSDLPKAIASLKPPLAPPPDSPCCSQATHVCFLSCCQKEGKQCRWQRRNCR